MAIKSLICSNSVGVTEVMELNFLESRERLDGKSPSSATEETDRSSAEHFSSQSRTSSGSRCSLTSIRMASSRLEIMSVASSFSSKSLTLTRGISSPMTSPDSAAENHK